MDRSSIRCPHGYEGVGSDLAEAEYVHMNHWCVKEVSDAQFNHLRFVRELPPKKLITEISSS